MSSYLNIYVRKANTETCISLVSYSRSNRIYETFEQVFGNNIESWDNPKCQSLTIGDLNAWTDYIEAEIEHDLKRTLCFALKIEHLTGKIVNES